MIVTITIVLIVLQRNCNSHLTRRSVFHLGPTVLHALLSVLISPCLRKSGQSRKSKKLFRFHSFIHYGDLYSAPSRLLLRSAPDPCTTKKKSFETRVECVRKNPGEQSLRQRKPIPHRGTNHRECTGLGCGCTSKRNKE